MEQSRMMKKGKMDLHTHSLYSDGDRTPEQLAALVADYGVDMWALSDHDCIGGISEALEAGKKRGITVVPAAEFDNEFPQELHILGLCIDHNSPALQDALAGVAERRAERNALIVKRLCAAGYDIRPFIKADKQGVITRLHIAAALQDGGFCRELKDGFALMKPGAVGYAPAHRLKPSEVISVIREAGGMPVLAHPCHLKGNVHLIVNELVSMGLKGIEAYYTTSTEGQTNQFLSMARQYGLFVTCGSDFHGEKRPLAKPGCAYRETEEMEKTRTMIENRLRTGV